MRRYSQLDALSAPTYVAIFIERTLLVLEYSTINAQADVPVTSDAMVSGRRDDVDWSFNLVCPSFDAS